MFLQRPYSYFVGGIFIAESLSVIVSGSANAGGFSKSTGYGTFGAASSQTSVKAKSRYFDYSSRTSSRASTESLFNGKILGADGVARNTTRFKGKGKVHYKQWKAAKAKVYAKGGNVLAKARSENRVTIYVSGKAYVVTHEVARAVARFTPLGTTAAADNRSHIEIKTNGYVSTISASTAKATVRVKN